MDITPQGHRWLPMVRRDLFEFLRSRDFVAGGSSVEGIESIYNFVLQTNKLAHCPEDKVQKDLKRTIKQFGGNLKVKWKKSNYTLSTFLNKKNNADWLEENIIGSQVSLGGRPKKKFSEGSEKTKRRLVESLLNQHSADELEFAARVAHRTAGRRNLAEVIKKASSKSPRSLKSMVTTPITTQAYTPEEALGLMISLDLSKHQYISIQKGAKERNITLYPSYSDVVSKKMECYPDKTSTVVTETMGEVKLQALLDHTARRLVLSEQNTIMLTIPIPELSNFTFTLIHKWGLDGSSGHSLYKQKFMAGSEAISDANILLTSVVPLQLVAEHQQSSRSLMLWKNPRPSSTRFCRPLRFQFLHENTENTVEEYNYVQEQISRLIPSSVSFCDQNIEINHSLLKTMVDAKVCNALLDNSSSQKCYMCGASPKQMNDLPNVTLRICDQNSLSFGLSTLHAHIRFFECLLHVSYRLEIKKWQVRGSNEEKENFARRKTAIISTFRTETGLLVDVVIQGHGTTNDGNTARRFFADPEKSLEITGVNVHLIQRFSVILQTLACGLDIDKEAFQKYALDTAKLFVDLYPWFYMPCTVHKILLHGADVIGAMILPIGQLSEDAQEARHKEIRYYREHRTRKISRQATNEDLLHILLASSDPLISNLRPVALSANKESLPPEVLSLLKV